jgi:hypothetical protein
VQYLWQVQDLHTVKNVIPYPLKILVKQLLKHLMVQNAGFINALKIHKLPNFLRKPDSKSQIPEYINLGFGI